MAPATPTNTVRSELDEVEEPMTQEEFIELLIEQTDLTREDILQALRTLMEEDQVSYNLNWNLQLEQSP